MFSSTRFAVKGRLRRGRGFFGLTALLNAERRSGSSRLVPFDWLSVGIRKPESEKLSDGGSDIRHFEEAQLSSRRDTGSYGDEAGV